MNINHPGPVYVLQSRSGEPGGGRTRRGRGIHSPQAASLLRRSPVGRHAGEKN
ncbi:hypothetical protein ASZ90_009470 [hydrocarbon metagenome]|uniref:Uncharacterized protein n=1 Tax=hydrocarbon metagenome TaxID=938273 RepID=A0A0W8FIR2_9ZZZZ